MRKNDKSSVDEYLTTKEITAKIAELKMRYIFQEEIEEKIEAIETDAHDSSVEEQIENADNKIRKIIRKTIGTNTSKNSLWRLGNWALKIASGFIIVAFIGLTVGIATVPSIRNYVLELLIESHDEYTIFSLEQTGALLDSPPGWQGYYFPQYIPEGFKMIDIDEDYVRYENEQGDMLAFSELTYNDVIHVDTENAEINTFTIGNCEYRVVEKNDHIFVIWSIGNRFFVVETSVNKAFAVDVAMSVVMFK